MRPKALRVGQEQVQTPPVERASGQFAIVVVISSVFAVSAAAATLGWLAAAPAPAAASASLRLRLRPLLLLCWCLETLWPGASAPLVANVCSGADACADCNAAGLPERPALCCIL